MNPTSAPAAPARLRGSISWLDRSWFTVLRSSWLLIAATSSLLLVLGVGPLLDQLHQVCDAAACSGPAAYQLSTEGLQALQDAHLSLDSYAALVVGVDLVSGLIWIGVASLVFWKASDAP